MTKTSLSDPTNQLSEAIRKLEAFSLHGMGEAHSGVSKTITLIRERVWKVLNSASKKQSEHSKSPDQDEVLNAVEFINSKRLLIQKLKTGSSAEQKLADSLTQAIETYNACCEKRLKAFRQLKGLAKFLAKEKSIPSQEMPKIDLLPESTIAYHYPEKASDTSEAPTPFSPHSVLPTAISLSKQSAELFQMKALALLERYGIASNPEARALVKQAPIHTMEANASTYTLKQTLALFPGQIVVVRGSSALDPKTQTINKLFPETFFISIESTQTGFPHPSQRAGWALASQLLPEYPQRIDLLRETAVIFQRKKQAMQELLPHGSLINKAKRLLQIKKRVFAAHAQEGIALHRALFDALISAAPEQWVTAEVKETIFHFYEILKKHPTPFEWLVETNQSLRDHFLAGPHQILLDSILKGKSTDLGSLEADVRYQAAKSTLEQALAEASAEALNRKALATSPYELAKWNYIVALGTLIGRGAIPIILQYLSEDLIFLPPSLSLFECKIQLLAYSHLNDFLNELDLCLDKQEQNSHAIIYELIKRNLDADRAVFQSTTPDPLNIELAQYFQKRYLSLSTL